MRGPRSSRGFALGARVSLLFLAVLSCGDSSTEPAPPDPPRATTVSVSPASGTLAAVGDTLRLSARVQDQNGQVMAGADVLWTSSADPVAMVDASGLVRAAGDGTAVIEAAAEGASGTATVTVERKPSVVTVIPREAVLAPGDTLRLSVLVEDANGFPIEGALVVWSSDNRDVVAVEGDGGLVRAIGSGVATVTATAVWHTPSGRVEGTADVTVLTTAGSVFVTPPEATLAVGDTVWISAEVRDAKGEPDPDAVVEWETSDASVATVDAAGLVRALGRGSTTITARSGAVSGTARVTVLAAAGSVFVTPPEATLAVGDTVRISAEVWDAEGVPIQDAVVEWSTDDASVATVDAAGLVRALGRGSTTITARSGAVSGTARVTVVTTAGSVVVTPAEPVLTVGDELPLEAEIRDTEGAPMSGTGVRWETSDARVAVVDAAGLVRALGRGRATVTARSGQLSGRAEVTVVERSDRGALASLYHATGGANWVESTNWLTDAPLGDWHGVTTDQAGRVMNLELASNNLVGPIPAQLAQLTRLGKLSVERNGLSGPIPPELGQLSRLRQLYLFFTQLSGEIPPELGQLEALEELWLERIPLSGPIPPELGNLTRLEFLAMPYSNLSGPIPPELGRLTRLEKIYLGTNQLSGEIPPELGRLTRLNTLNLLGNRLTGPIPPELGALSALEFAWFHENALTGPIPREFGNLSSARILFLANNDLSGGVPAAFGRLERLEFLNLSNNPKMIGVLPPSLTALDQLDTFHAGGTALCAPDEAGFRAWLATVQTRRVASCPSERRSRAYLTQAVQSLDYPVPLVAGRPALLRVFVTALRETGARVPPVRARFYHGGAEVHVAEIPAGAEPIPAEIQEGRLATSADARIPASVVRPGLEMVIEIDPDGTLDPGLGVERRIPATGRAAVEVERMPALPLTWIPMVSQERPDSSIVDLTRGLTAGSPFFWPTRNLLPIDELDLTVHDVVLTSTRDADALLREVEAIRVMEGGTGYYMGAMANLTGAAGVAYTPGRSSVVGPGELVAAHELGHNLNLSHAPCGGAGSPDPSFPSPNASIGAWGYDFRDGSLIPPGYKDLMSYCESQWISDFHFTKALLYRLNREAAAAAPVRPPAVESLLLWGGLDGTGAPVLEPSFVVDAPPVLPRESGAYELTGESGDGEVLFSLGFEMPEVADGGAPSFAFALPVRGEWAGRLERIRLAGPGGSASLDAGSERPMTITRDAASGRVLSLLRGGGTPDAAPAPGPELDLLFSRGVPEEAAWQR